MLQRVVGLTASNVANRNVNSLESGGLMVEKRKASDAFWDSRSLVSWSFKFRCIVAKYEQVAQVL